MIKNLLGDDDDRPASVPENTPPAAKNNRHFTSLFDSDLDPGADDVEKENFVLSSIEPESFAETTRKSGLAWSAGIAFFASVVFMMIIGWGADLLFGSSPWGLVGGIVLGSIIGFVQFFRLASQIFK